MFKILYGKMPSPGGVLSKRNSAAGFSSALTASTAKIISGLRPIFADLRARVASLTAAADGLASRIGEEELRSARIMPVRPRSATPRTQMPTRAEVKKAFDEARSLLGKVQPGDPGRAGLELAALRLREILNSFARLN